MGLSGCDLDTEGGGGAELNLQQLLGGRAILLLLHQAKHAQNVTQLRSDGWLGFRGVRVGATQLRGERHTSAYFKKSENRGLQAEGSARVGGGCFGTRNRTFMGWLAMRELHKSVELSTGCATIKSKGRHFEAMRGGSSSAISIALHTTHEAEAAEARGRRRRNLMPSDQTSARPS